jgi:hypothetical protein
MNATITKKKIAQTIDDLPEDTTVEEAMEQLTLLHKVSIGLQQSEQGQGMSQDEVERRFRQRKSRRNS